ncbi:uncharacterized protein MYCFIDRAFT_194479 [Pseudocercospora fijiensis CIRAD86]|uniref:Uncharacterized protein n=1 Tax=Pseudocercospora fijiensis (strain CIRAD86) TaxID=383855 RepID=M3A5K1_PSEFD|nr:uncharacterized protein MYCFIDRAFT_194479 [Pseudocercospora fijiensis CIRAD86]EME86409.1 hypothetical protein MYCFIDRAFT_194479 [Pseudocercospora fijiensis CIRAD86]
MSDPHLLSVSTEEQPTGRGKRVKKPSPKVRDAAASAGHLSSPLTHLPRRKVFRTTNNALTALGASATSSASSKPPAGHTTNPQVNNHSSGGTPAGVAKTAKEFKKPRAHTMARPRQPKSQQLPSLTARFSAATLIIYQWPTPNPPKSFLDLSGSNRRWKNRKDEEEQAADAEDGVDDWEAYDGDANMYGGPEGIANAVASTFVKRAKRAFWKGQTWEEFEAAELGFNLKEAVEASDDQSQRRVLEFEPLNNGLRLDVFDRIKERLCNEIWLEAYPPSRPYTVNGATSRRDTRAPTPITSRTMAEHQIMEKERTTTAFEARDAGSFPVYGGHRLFPYCNVVFKDD